MDADDAIALGYVAALIVHEPVSGERLQCVYPLDDCIPHEELDEEAAVRFTRLWESGPEPDGWGVYASPDYNGTQYQLLLRLVDLPDLGS